MNNKKRGIGLWVVVLVCVFIGIIVSEGWNLLTTSDYSYSDFQQDIQTKAEQIEDVVISPNKETPTGMISVEWKNSSKEESFYVTDVNQVKEWLESVNYTDYKETDVINREGWFYNNGALLVLGGIFLWFLFSFINSQQSGGGNKMTDFGKSHAKMTKDGSHNVTFRDVAGLQEEKEDLQEIVDFLKSPEKYTKVGARIPKGVILVGPPGTGKTLLAKAVAGEAGVPFFSISGSDFVEMFVGVGASRVRDLFKEAQKQAPCIIFIDEIDAIGKSRDARYGGNDEREQTLNQLLSEMDGFDASKGLLILAATNRPEVLDKALLRPGRFDRRIIVDKPDLKGREAILQVHAKDVLMDETVDLNAIALATSGAVGSDLANMINEAAINAVKHGRKYVSQADLFESVEVVIAGKEKKDRIMGPKEKKIVAYHEVGHALVTALQKNTEPVQKITIVPRTHGALGYVMQVPEEEKFLKSKEELEEDLVTFMAGRAAEEIVFHSVTTGASNDIEQATRIARAMVVQYGMSERFGLMGLATVESQYLDGEARLNCGEETAAEIDKEVMKMLKESYEKAKQLLSENREVLDKIAAHLYEKENITGKEFMKIYRELKGIPEPEEENVAKQGSSVDFRVGEEATHTVDLNKATSEKEESEEEDPNKENSREEDFEQETDV